MKKEFLVVLCAAVLMLCGVGMANAASTVTWHMLEHSSIAGKGPGSDGLVGGGADTTDNCNFAPDSPNRATCTGGPTPSVGSYSINRINFAPTEECIDNLFGIASGGTPCKCNDNSTNCDPGTNQNDVCPDVQGGCGTVAGKCCPTNFSCQPCQDANSYFGSGGAGNSSGTMGTCTDSTQIKTTSFDVGTTPSLPIGGGGCIQLGSSGSQPNRATPCTANGTISGYLDADVYVGGCDTSKEPAFEVPDVPYSGRVFPVGSVPSGVCGYTQSELTTIKNNALAASGNTAKSIMVVCGTTPIPATINLPCFPGANVDFIMIGWTADTIDCTQTCQ